MTPHTTEWEELQDLLNEIFPDGTDLVSLDGDARGYKQRIMDVVEILLFQQKQEFKVKMEKMEDDQTRSIYENWVELKALLNENA